MIDRVSNLGFFEVVSPTTLNSSAAGTGLVGGGIFNLITSQAQGRVAFYLDAASASASVIGPTLIVTLQTATDNATWSNVSGAQFATVTNVSTTGGVQSIFVDTASLSQYNRIYATVTGTTPGFVVSVVAVYPQKNA